MNKFESVGQEPSSEVADLVEHYEVLEIKERYELKEECGPHIAEFEKLIAPLLE